MHIELLFAQGFRNLQTVRLAPQSQVIVLQGHNAQGKTNILEALYLCATGRSFRNAAARDMLAHGQEAGDVRAQLVRHGVRHAVDVHVTPKGRQLKVDDRGLRHVTELLELMNMVAFFPDDLRIAKGSPEERRRFLDRAVANSRPAFVTATLAYHKALRSRNALLRGPTPPDRTLLGAYDDQLVQYGVVMHQCRESFLQELVPVAQEHFAQMMPRRAQLSVRLLSGVPAVDARTTPGVTAGPGDFAAALAAALQAGYPRDRARGMTLVGPHRADMLFGIGGQDARLYASQGQQRALILALKLAEVVGLKATLGAPPILLLDDVSSELDAERSRLLFQVVTGIECQVWVTTTGAVRLPLPASAQTFLVENGTVQEAPGWT